MYGFVQCTYQVYLLNTSTCNICTVYHCGQGETHETHEKQQMKTGLQKGTENLSALPLRRDLTNANALASGLMYDWPPPNSSPWPRTPAPRCRSPSCSPACTASCSRLPKKRVKLKMWLFDKPVFELQRLLPRHGEKTKSYIPRYISPLIADQLEISKNFANILNIVSVPLISLCSTCQREKV